MTPREPLRSLRLAILLTGRDVRARLQSIWYYGLASFVCAIVAFFASTFHKSFLTESVVVSADPFAVVQAIVLVFLAVGLGMGAATALSWEREHRTMEVLLSGPVTVSALVVAKLAAEMATLVAMVAVYSTYVFLVRPISEDILLTSSSSTCWRLSILVLPIIGLGLLISASVSTVRAAVILFLLVTLLLAGLEGMSVWLNAQDANSLSLSALYTRSALATVTDWLWYVSPVAYAADLLRYAAGEEAPSVARSAGAVALLLALTLASILVTQRRGAI